MLIALIVCSAACFLAALAVYNGMFLGVHDTLSNAQKGGVYSFDYLQPNSGEHHRHIVKVLEVQKLDDNTIRRLNRTSNYRASDSIFKRTGTLIRAVDPTGEYRQFYAERCVSVHRLPLGGLRFLVGV
jgi:hypothetical protein